VETAASALLFAVLLSTIALIVALLIGIKGRKTLVVDAESLVMPKARSMKDGVEGRLDAVSEDLRFIATYLKIEKGINEYGSRIKEAYEDFMTRIEDEFKALEQRKIIGKEYTYKLNMLLFSLMMAKVYLEATGQRSSLSEIDQYIERAKRL